MEAECSSEARAAIDLLAFESLPSQTLRDVGASPQPSQVPVNAVTGQMAQSTSMDCWRTYRLDFADTDMLRYRHDGTRMGCQVEKERLGFCT